MSSKFLLIDVYLTFLFDLALFLTKGIWTHQEFAMAILTVMVVKMKLAVYANLGSIFAAFKEPKVGYEFTKL